MDATGVFEAQRPRLLALAYRMLGGVSDAEDVVQDAWLRWERADTRTAVETPPAYLRAMVTRLCIDRLRHLKTRRESYVGPWLPEPVPEDMLAGTGEEAQALAESLRFGVLLLLERLSPVQRAVFVLRELLDCEYDEVAAATGRSAATCRQIFLRARARGIGHVFRVEDTRLLFGPRDLTGSPAATAELGKNLLELFIRTTVLGQVGAIEARGWDPEDQKEVVASVAHTKLRSRMGGQTSGLARADDGFGAEVSSAQGVAIAGKDAAIPGSRSASPAEVAAAAAAAELEGLALEHVRCEGSLLGDPALRPGTVLAIKGLGRRFSGDYWLTRVTHSFDGDGFRTGFEGRRTAT